MMVGGPGDTLEGDCKYIIGFDWDMIYKRVADLKFASV